MVDTPTPRYGARQQSLGSNVNTWGDTKLNDVILLFDRGSKGAQSIPLTGSVTLNWTNYAANNDGQVQTLRFTGALSSPASVTVPSREWAFTVINAAGNAVTVKTSAGTGVSIPTGHQAALYCDGADVRNAGPTLIPGNLQVDGAVQVGGKITNLETGAGASDAVTKGQMDAAIAAATTSSSPGTVRISGNDTTAKFLEGAVTTHMSGAATFQVATLNPGGNEKLAFSVGVSGLALADGGVQSGDFNIAPNTKYIVDSTATTQITATGPGAPQVGDITLLTKFGVGTLTFDLNGLNYYGRATNPASAREGVTLLIYTGAVRGWVDL